MAFFQDSVVSLFTHNMTILLLLGLQILQLQEPQHTGRLQVSALILLLLDLRRTLLTVHRR